MGKIVMFLGPSSSGKDTIKNNILVNSPYNFKEITMHTTRPKRTGEVNGKDYFFDTVEDLRKLEEERKIIELRKYDTIMGPWYYYTTSSNIDLEKNNYISLNTLVGLQQFTKFYPKEQIISILIQVEESMRLERAIKREKREKTPSYQEVCRRFLADSIDFSKENIEKSNITAIINNNGTIQETIQEVNKVLSLHM